MKAVIMAGGQGTRLRPLSCDLPKPMVPILNRPMLEHIVALLARHGIRDIAVTTCYLPESIEAYFGDGERFGVRLKYYVEDVPLGTAGSVKNAERFLDETFLVISGDALTDFDLTAAAEFHRVKKATASIVLTRVDNPLEYGVVITAPGGAIRRFLEKPSWSEVFSDTVNTGIYLLEPSVLSHYEKGKNFDFSKDLFPLLLKEGQALFGYIAAGYWSDIGNLDQYRQSHYDILEGRVNLVPQGREVRPGVWAGEGTEIGDEVRLIPPVVFGDYVRVESGCQVGPYTVVGDHAVIKAGASVRRSLIWQGAIIDRHVQLRGAVVADRAVIRSGASVFEGAIVGKGVTIGPRAQVKPGVKIWPSKVVDAGVTLASSFIWGNRSPRALFGELGVTGLANVEVTPEFAAKLGAALASSLRPKSQVVTSCDGYLPAGMIKQAFIAGLTSGGVNVVDLGEVITPVARFCASAMGAAAGAHVRRAPRGEDFVLIQFLDSQGLDVDRGTQRKIENLFFREDFDRVQPASVGRVAFFSRAIDRYLSGLLAMVNTRAISQAGFRVVTLAPPGTLAVLLPGFFAKLGCTVKTVPEYAEGEPPLDQLAAAVKAEEATAGVVVDPVAEKVRLMDEAGRLATEEAIYTLLAGLSLRSGGDCLAVPATAPSSVEKVAAAHGARIERTKVNPRASMEGAMRVQAFNSTKGAPFFHAVSDALLTLALILETMAVDRVPLSRLIAGLPESHVVSDDVPCAWEAKGRVMRSLLEEFASDDESSGMAPGVDLTDGIRVEHDGGWTLVLPDADAPYFHVYSEGTSSQRAAELANHYRRKIAALSGADIMQ